MDLSELRRNYLRHGLDESEVDPLPTRQLALWLKEARDASPGEWFECNAMTLATTSLRGEVSARIVLLKSLGDDGLTFFTSYDSAKAKQLAENPHASCVFYWAHLERQVRIEGTVEKTSAAVSDEYFASRPRGSQLGAHASAQSQPVSSREDLQQSLAEIERRYGDGPIPRPESWGGYLLRPSHFEFWQGRPNRLHDRIAYLPGSGNQWKRQRLGP